MFAEARPKVPRELEEDLFRREAPIPGGVAARDRAAVAASLLGLLSSEWSLLRLWWEEKDESGSCMRRFEEYCRFRRWFRARNLYVSTKTS